MNKPDNEVELVSGASDQGLISQSDASPIDREVQRQRELALLYHCSRRHHDIKIVRCLLNQGVNPNIKNSRGGSPLMISSIYNKLDIVKALYDAGANINAQDDSGNTALIYAAICGEFEVLKFLVEQGVDIHTRNKNGVNALEAAILTYKPSSRIKIVAYIIDRFIKRDRLNVINYLNKKGSILGYDMYPVLNAKGISWTPTSGYIGPSIIGGPVYAYPVSPVASVTNGIEKFNHD